MTKRYRLTICAGEPEEQVVYAHLTENDLEMIMADMRGELNCEYLITLDNGEIIDTGIIDDITEMPERPYIYERYDELLAIAKTRTLDESEAVELAEISGTIQALEVERDYLNGECSIGGHYYEEE